MKTSNDKTPSRPRSAYNHFFHDEQRCIRETAGYMVSYSEMSKLVAARWRKIDPQKKAYYSKLAAQDKRRFALEMIAFKIQQEEASKLQQFKQASQAQVYKPCFPQQQNNGATRYEQAPIIPLQGPSDNKNFQDTPKQEAISDFLGKIPDVERKLRLMLEMLQCFQSQAKCAIPQSHFHRVKQDHAIDHNVRARLHERDTMLLALPPLSSPPKADLNGFRLEDVPLLEELFGIGNK